MSSTDYTSAETGANSKEMEGKQAKQLWSLSKEKAIGKVIGKWLQVLRLWKWLLLSVKESYS